MNSTHIFFKLQGFETILISWVLAHKKYRFCQHFLAIKYSIFIYSSDRGGTHTYKDHVPHAVFTLVTILLVIHVMIDAIFGHHLFRRQVNLLLQSMRRYVYFSIKLCRGVQRLLATSFPHHPINQLS